MLSINYEGPDWFERIEQRLDSLTAEEAETANLLLFYHQGGGVQDKVRELVQQAFSRFAEGGEDEEKNHALRCLQVLGWARLYHRQCLQSVAEVVAAHVRELCAERDDGFGSSLLPALRAWEESSLRPFLSQLFAGDEELCAQTARETLRVFVQVSAESLFEMIADFPDSLPALRELRDGIARSDCLGAVGRDTRQRITKRLLHLGASTTQILDFYVSMIKALRVVDPSDTLLNYVALPVRSYLKERKDTIRCIISSLTDSSDGDLHSELRQGGSLAYGVDEDDEEGGPGVNWTPSPRNKELNDAALSSSSKGLDVLATLVSIYGSTELFIVEYKALLAARMTNTLSYVTDQELANLELLKIRFGEESLHSCEVMLKDIEDSKRFNTAVHANEKATESVDFVVVSDHYWPAFNSCDMKPHARIDEVVNKFCETFAVLKKPRKLKPLHNVGVVELQLSFDNGVERSFSVTPLQANVILHFEEGSSKSLQDLWMEMEMDEEDCAMALKFWVGKKVLREREDPTTGDMLFEIIEDQTNNSDADENNSDEEDNNESADNSRLKATRDLVINYIKSLLNSHGAMSIDKLSSLLQLVLQAEANSGNSAISMASSEMSFVTSMSGLRQFMQQLNDQGLVEIIDGLYSIAKK